MTTRRNHPLPPLGLSPSTLSQGTTPGSFANRPVIAPGPVGAKTFSSPDTPGMPPPSHRTAWDFLPAGWATEEAQVSRPVPLAASGGTGLQTCAGSATCEQGSGTFRRVTSPAGFTPVTQLEHARLGIITPQMRRVAEREPHLSPEQLRDEVAAGRMVIPANKTHLGYRL